MLDRPSHKVSEFKLKYNKWGEQQMVHYYDPGWIGRSQVLGGDKECDEESNVQVIGVMDKKSV